jgi:hypothetical protein
MSRGDKELARQASQIRKPPAKTETDREEQVETWMVELSAISGRQEGELLKKWC